MARRELLAQARTPDAEPLTLTRESGEHVVRVRLFVADLLDHLTSERPAYDAILIDIDNGPEAFTASANARLYALAGLAAVYGALVPRGVMVLWSAFRSAQFEQRLRKVGFAARSVTVRARGPLGKGTRHTLFVATRPSAD